MWCWLTMKNYIKEFFDELEAHPEYDKEKIAKLKLRLCKTHKIKKVPTDIAMFMHADAEQIKKFRRRLQTKPNRSLSGVAPVAIMTSPANCPHGRCTMCPGGLNSEWGDTPQSYTGAEPATMRGMRAGYDAYLQVFNRLEQYVVTGHHPDKVDLIIMGGTFPAREDDYQEEYVWSAFKAMNDFSEQFYDKAGELKLEYFKEFFELPGEIGEEKRTKRIHEKLHILKGKIGTTSTLLEEQTRNETTTIRCIGLTIETKPDWSFLKHANKMLLQGCTRVELGVQSVYDEPLKLIHRGHTVADNKKAIQILKDLGFKVNYHMMIGLPEADTNNDERIVRNQIVGEQQTVDGLNYSTKNEGRLSKEKDIEGLQTLFTDSDYRPDMIKIYPNMVMPKTKLFLDYKKGLFKPVELEEAADIIAEFLPTIKPYCRLMRVQRDIPTYRTIAGVDKTNLRQYVDIKMKEKNVRSNDIRAREIGRRKLTSPLEPELIIEEYKASGGKEFFISYEDKKQEILVGFCRLRFPGKQLREEFTPTTAMIRELHVYGQAVNVGGEDQSSSQHKGYGKRLMAEAERTAKENGYDKMLVISGVGVRKYYEKLGYVREGPYMSKKL